jgi:AbiV family abortive infection protein
MNLSKKECLLVSQDCIANSNSKHSDAITLASSGSYGNATSQLMLSLEEMMKAIVLNLDGNGFEFRNRVKGIGNLFENHRLRYFLAFTLSVMNVFGQDLKKLLIKTINSPEEFLNLKMEDPGLQHRLTLWVIVKMEFIQKEIVWFSNADLYRQDGFYVEAKCGVARWHVGGSIFGS